MSAPLRPGRSTRWLSKRHNVRPRPVSRCPTNSAASNAFLVSSGAPSTSTPSNWPSGWTRRVLWRGAPVSSTAWRGRSRSPLSWKNRSRHRTESTKSSMFSKYSLHSPTIIPHWHHRVYFEYNTRIVAKNAVDPTERKSQEYKFMYRRVKQYVRIYFISYFT